MWWCAGCACVRWLGRQGSNLQDAEANRIQSAASSQLLSSRTVRTIGPASDTKRRPALGFPSSWGHVIGGIVRDNYWGRGRTRRISLSLLVVLLAASSGACASDSNSDEPLVKSDTDVALDTAAEPEDVTSYLQGDWECAFRSGVPDPDDKDVDVSITGNEWTAVLTAVDGTLMVDIVPSDEPYDGPSDAPAFFELNGFFEVDGLSLTLTIGDGPAADGGDAYVFDQIGLSSTTARYTPEHPGESGMIAVDRSRDGFNLGWEQAGTGYNTIACQRT